MHLINENKDFQAEVIKPFLYCTYFYPCISCSVNVFNLVMKWNVACELSFWAPAHVILITAYNY